MVSGAQRLLWFLSFLSIFLSYFFLLEQSMCFLFIAPLRISIISFHKQHLDSFFIFIRSFSFFHSFFSPPVQTTELFNFSPLDRNFPLCFFLLFHTLIIKIRSSCCLFLFLSRILFTHEIFCLFIAHPFTMAGDEHVHSSPKNSPKPQKSTNHTNQSTCLVRSLCIWVIITTYWSLHHLLTTRISVLCLVP